MNWRNRNLLITAICCVISAQIQPALSGRNGQIRHRSDEEHQDVRPADTSAPDIIEKVENSYELSSEELNGGDISSDDGWNNQPDVICLEGAPNSVCKCTDSPRTIDCKSAKLKANGRPLDSAFLSMNKGMSFSAQIADLSFNEIQILRKNHILPNEVNDLVVLDVSNNWLTDIQPYALEPFTKLAKLKLSHNRLTDLEISDDWLTPTLGKTLHQLYLDYNYIEHLDDGIFDNLVNLTKLILDGNNGLKLTRHTFGSALTKLRTISLDNCGITSLEEDVFKKLPNLEQLSLAGNPITQIVPALRQTPKLSVLSLSGTHLTEIPKLAFKWNTELRRVYMTGMKYLKSVKSCAFCRLEELQVIDFTNSSELAIIDENAFGGMSDKEVLPNGITDLLLSNCSLTNLGEKLLNWNALRRLGADGNAWNCNCTFYWLLGNWKLHKFTGPEPSCSTPENFKDIPLRTAYEKMECVGPLPARTTDAPNENAGADSSLMSSTVFICVLLVGVVVSASFGGAMFVRREGGTQAAWARIRQFGQPHGDSSLGYANLDRGGGGVDGAAVVGANVDDYGDAANSRLEEDFNRPEFV